MDVVQQSLGEPKCFPICLCTSCLSITLMITPSLHTESVIRAFLRLFWITLNGSDRGKCMVICTDENNTRAAVFLICLTCCEISFVFGERKEMPELYEIMLMTDFNNKRFSDLECAMRDVVNVHGEDIVFAAHIHPVLVLVHLQDPVVHGLFWNAVVLKGLGGLQVWGTHREEKGLVKQRNKHAFTPGFKNKSIKLNSREAATYKPVYISVIKTISLN